jgi:heptosyltransferase-3
MSVRPARILVLRGGALGDFIVTLPALRALRVRWPDGRIELIGYPRVARLALRGGLVDEVHSLDQAGMARFFAARPAFSEEQAEFVRSFDIVLNYLHDPHGQVEENMRLAGARVLIMASPLVRERHAADHFLRPLQSLAIYDADPIPRLIDPSAAGAAVRSNRLVIHPGSGSPRKNWPLDRFLAVAARALTAGHEPLFLLGEVEQGLADAIADAGYAARIEAPLDELVDLLADAGAYLGNDSGISHLAAACGCPSVVLFGPSDPGQWAPRGCVKILRSPRDDIAALPVSSAWSALQAIGFDTTS